jgi:hypothetical protein
MRTVLIVLASLVLAGDALAQARTGPECNDRRLCAIKVSVTGSGPSCKVTVQPDLVTLKTRGPTQLRDVRVRWEIVTPGWSFCRANNGIVFNPKTTVQFYDRDIGGPLAQPPKRAPKGGECSDNYVVIAKNTEARKYPYRLTLREDASGAFCTAEAQVVNGM